MNPFDGFLSSRPVVGGGWVSKQVIFTLCLFSGILRHLSVCVGCPIALSFNVLFKVLSHFATGLIRKVVELAEKSRRDSLLSLENVPIDDPFLKKGVQLCVDGTEPEVGPPST